MVFDSSPQALPLDTADERRLVIQARAGHRLAREELATRFRRPAYLLALQIVGNQDDALDITQDAMLRFFEHLGRFRPEHAVRPWLFTIVRNRARDLWRRRATRPSESLECRSDLSGQLAHPALDPEQQASRRERERQVWDAIGAMSPNHREILVLRDFHDLAYSDIAEVLQIPVGTVMSRLHAARAALGQLVKEGTDNG